MLGEQYPQFTFTSLTISTATVYPTTTPYSIESKHALYPGDSFTVQVSVMEVASSLSVGIFDNTTTAVLESVVVIIVQVEFKHQIGCFPQVVVFKFNSFFMGTLLKVTCMSEDSFELQNQHRHTTVTQ